MILSLKIAEKDAEMVKSMELTTLTTYNFGHLGFPICRGWKSGEDGKNDSNYNYNNIIKFSLQVFPKNSDVQSCKL
jgi:hypothetical protein